MGEGVGLGGRGVLVGGGAVGVGGMTVLVGAASVWVGGGTVGLGGTVVAVLVGISAGDGACVGSGVAVVAPPHAGRRHRPMVDTMKTVAQLQPLKSSFFLGSVSRTVELRQQYTAFRHLSQAPEPQPKQKATASDDHRHNRRLIQPERLSLSGTAPQQLDHNQAPTLRS